MSTTINKADQAYDLLEGMITFQGLEPGSMVSEGTLMELTGLGRSPVRDALQRLAWERMVEIHPRRGVIVPPFQSRSSSSFWNSGAVWRNWPSGWPRTAPPGRSSAAMLQLADELEGVRTPTTCAPMASS